MFSLTGFKVCFTPRWQMTVLAVLVISLFMRLGFWQIHRAHEKKQMIGSYQAETTKTPMEWQVSNQLPTQYENIRVTGHFGPDVLLLDNQHYHHQFGYHVISPLEIANGQIILIDRGWIVGDITRETLPKISTPQGLTQIVGHVYFPSSKNWAFGHLTEREEHHVWVVELIDTELISQFLHKSVYPFMIRLSKNEKDGYVREWNIVSMPPERHYAYALQWFLMALVIFILFIVRNTTIKKQHENESV